MPESPLANADVVGISTVPKEAPLGTFPLTIPIAPPESVRDAKGLAKTCIRLEQNFTGPNAANAMVLDAYANDPLNEKEEDAR